MLRESKGNMYSWVTHTWNPVKGECSHGCTYCYMHRWGKQKPIRLDESEFKSDLGHGNFIFVGSSCDLFAEDVDLNWIGATLNHCRRFENTYLFQSKNPGRMYDASRWMPVGSRVCTTIETNRVYPEFMGNTITPYNRAMYMQLFEQYRPDMERYVTIEPIMDFDLSEIIDLIDICKPKQVNIGADSGNNHLPEPSREKLLQLIEFLKDITVIDTKKNLNRLLK